MDCYFEKYNLKSIFTIGNITDKGPTSDVYILDTKNTDNYKWITSINTDTSGQPDNSSSSSNSNTGTIIGVVVGCIIGLILLVVGTFWFYKSYKSK